MVRASRKINAYIRRSIFIKVGVAQMHSSTGGHNNVIRCMSNFFNTVKLSVAQGSSLKPAVLSIGLSLSEWGVKIQYGRGDET